MAAPQAWGQVCLPLTGHKQHPSGAQAAKAGLKGEAGRGGEKSTRGVKSSKVSPEPTRPWRAVPTRSAAAAPAGVEAQAGPSAAWLSTEGSTHTGPSAKTETDRLQASKEISAPSVTS